MTRALPLPGAPATDVSPLGPDLHAGFGDLDAMRPLRPGALTLLDASSGLRLVEAYLADAALSGRVVLVADGGNSLDAYRLAAAARRRAVERFPDAPRRDLAVWEETTLERVRVARGFTVHQLQAIVEDALPREAARALERGEDVGLVAAPGLLEMSLDEDVARDEARVLARRAIGALRDLAARLRAPALVTGGILAPGAAHPLRQMLEESADEIVRARETAAGGAVIDLPRRGARFVVPPRQQRRMEDYFRDAAPERPAAPARIPAPRGASYRYGRLWSPRHAEGHARPAGA